MHDKLTRELRQFAHDVRQVGDLVLTANPPALVTGAIETLLVQCARFLRGKDLGAVRTRVSQLSMMLDELRSQLGTKLWDPRLPPSGIDGPRQLARSIQEWGTCLDSDLDRLHPPTVEPGPATIEQGRLEEQGATSPGMSPPPGQASAYLSATPTARGPTAASGMSSRDDRLPVSARKSIGLLLQEIRAFSMEVERCTISVIAGRLPVKSAAAPARLTEAYARVLRAATQAKAKLRPQVPDHLRNVLDRLLDLHMLIGEGKNGLLQDANAGTVRFGESTILASKFMEDLQAVTLDLEDAAAVGTTHSTNTDADSARPLTERELLILRILEDARTRMDGRGVTAPEVWREMRQRKKDVSEDRIGRIIRDLRQRGFPIPNGRNGGGYLLARPLGELLQELGMATGTHPSA